MLTWLLLLVIVAGFYSCIIPGLSATFSIAAGTTYGLLVLFAVVAGVFACVDDPIDPNVRRFHEVRPGIVFYDERSSDQFLYSVFLHAVTFSTWRSACID